MTKIPTTDYEYRMSLKSNIDELESITLNEAVNDTMHPSHQYAEQEQEDQLYSYMVMAMICEEKMSKDKHPFSPVTDYSIQAQHKRELKEYLDKFEKDHLSTKQ